MFKALAFAIPSLLGLFGGGRGKQERVTETETPPAGYQDPMIGLISPLIIDIIMRQMRGYGRGSSVYSPWAQRIMDMLGGEFSGILSGAGSSLPPSGGGV